MHRAPVRPQQSPGAPRPGGRFPSPVSCWGFPGSRSPHGGSGYRGVSPRGGAAYSPGSPAYSPGSNRGYWDGSPAGFGSGSRGRGAQMRRRGDGFRRPQSFSPGSAQKFHGRFQFGSSDAAVEKYFSPSMLQDPWAALQPIKAADAGNN
ncbi:M-phase-specific PLK1-interacting protein [Scophthalmus maximus]|uniref:M-phase-specific PLK1-interacting protein n=1 Tax=Scophthalmus maximus TaxID=52904 RepID=UPI0015E0AECC|nr:M-phase-specific PLK1-interacting protein [Scophthalmus maximus]